MASTPPRQALRRWGNSLGIRLPASIAREARLHVDQNVELFVVEGGVMIRPVQCRLSLAERLAAYEPMAGEPTEAMAFGPLGADSFHSSVGLVVGCAINSNPSTGVPGVHVPIRWGDCRIPTWRR